MSAASRRNSNPDCEGYIQRVLGVLVYCLDIMLEMAPLAKKIYALDLRLSRYCR
jgi:hypothetical protein